MMRSPLLHQSCNKYLPFSFSPVTPCFPITPFHVSVTVPEEQGLESSKDEDDLVPHVASRHTDESPWCLFTNC